MPVFYFMMFLLKYISKALIIEVHFWKFSFSKDGKGDLQTKSTLRTRTIAGITFSSCPLK